jgi:hypothetical protein
MSGDVARIPIFPLGDDEAIVIAFESRADAGRHLAIAVMQRDVIGSLGKDEAAVRCRCMDLAAAIIMGPILRAQDPDDLLAPAIPVGTRGW